MAGTFSGLRERGARAAQAERVGGKWRLRSVRIDCSEGGAIADKDDPILEQVTRADLRSIYTRGLDAIAAAADLAALEAVRVRFLGRKAELVLLLR